MTHVLRGGCARENTSPQVSDRLAPFLVASTRPERFEELRGYFELARSGTQLLVRAREATFSAILIDMRSSVGGVSGFRLTKHLRAKSVDVPIVLVSEAALPTEVNYAKRCGARDLVSYSALSGIRPRQQDGMPTWFASLAHLLRYYIASEADHQLRRIVNALSSRQPGVEPDLGRVVSEAAALLDAEARASFKNMTRAFR